MSRENLNHWAELGALLNWFIENLPATIDDIYTPADEDDPQHTTTGVTQEMLDDVIRPALRSTSEVAATITGLYFQHQIAQQQRQNTGQMVHQPHPTQVVRQPNPYGH